MGTDKELAPVVTYINGQPFEGLTDETIELEPANPDDVTIPPELPELTFTLAAESAAAIAECIKSASDKARQALQQLADGITKAAAAAAEAASNLVEASLYTANDNPRWWHLYKHAKKARTRKKYRRLLMKQLLEQLKEART